MIRTLAEVRRDRALAAAKKSTGRVQVTLTAISQLDDVYAFTCNGDEIGEECPHDTWEPGDTSGLEDTIQEMAAHLRAHQVTYHTAPDYRSGLEDEAGADS